MEWRRLTTKLTNFVFVFVVVVVVVVVGCLLGFSDFKVGDVLLIYCLKKIWTLPSASDLRTSQIKGVETELENAVGMERE